MMFFLGVIMGVFLMPILQNLTEITYIYGNHLKTKLVKHFEKMGEIEVENEPQTAVGFCMRENDEGE